MQEGERRGLYGERKNVQNARMLWVGSYRGVDRGDACRVPLQSMAGFIPGKVISVLPRKNKKRKRDVADNSDRGREYPRFHWTN